MSVSILVCCHNGESRLRPTLEHLLAQRDCDDIAWEIVLVDNGSTDRTREFALELLSPARVPFTIVHESRPGKTEALLTGLDRCRHEFISIVDDDNWVCPRWVREVDDFLRAHPDVGIVGSLNEPVFEAGEPPWFSRVPGFFACGAHSVGAGDVTDSLGFVFGAGSTLRRCAWERLRALGFQFFCTTIRNARPSTGEDLELCLALVANGWRVHFEPHIRLQHFMPAARLTWENARRQARTLGTSALAIDPYCVSARAGQKAARFAALRQSWMWQALAKIRALLRRGAFPLKLWRAREGDVSVLYLDRELGALAKILAERGRYSRHLRYIARAAWRTHR